MWSLAVPMTSLSHSFDPCRAQHPLSEAHAPALAQRRAREPSDHARRPSSPHTSPPTGGVLTGLPETPMRHVSPVRTTSCVLGAAANPNPRRRLPCASTQISLLSPPKSHQNGQDGAADDHHAWDESGGAMWRPVPPVSWAGDRPFCVPANARSHSQHP